MDAKKQYQIEEIHKEEKGSHYWISCRIPVKEGWIDQVKIHFHNQFSEDLSFEKIENNTAVFSKIIYLKSSANYSFHFTYKANNIDKTFDQDGYPFKISVNFEVPDWAKGKIMYHIFVDRFHRGDFKKEILPHRTLYSSFEEEPKIGPNEQGEWNTDFYGGDLRGIIEKLDYIKSLGVSILYLSPIGKSQSNHRYDTGDYLEIDPYAGSRDDLKELCKEAHKKGMKVILDAVFNHTGNDSIYYNEFHHYPGTGAYHSKKSSYSSFYRKDQNGNFEYWWGNKNLPVCNGLDPAWRKYITGKGGVIDDWFSLGIDGLRLDVADELRDDFIMDIRKAVKRNKTDGFILGEVWENPMKMNREYISSGKAMDSVMDYVLMDALIRYYKFSDVDKLKEVLNSFLRDYPEDTIYSLMNFTSTHDISRAIEIFSSNIYTPNHKWAWDMNNGDLNFIRNHHLTKEEYSQGKEMLESYLFALTFLPGNLSIFYGDEIGLEGIGNLANRKPFPPNGKDDDLLRYFQMIGRIRKQEPFLEKASFRIRDINPEYFSFERIGEKEKMFVGVNRTNHEGYILIPPEYTQEAAYSLKKSSRNILTPYGGIAIKERK